jgi:hypothetical protein
MLRRRNGHCKYWLRKVEIALAARLLPPAGRVLADYLKILSRMTDYGASGVSARLK